MAFRSVVGQMVPNVYVNTIDAGKAISIQSNSTSSSTINLDLTNGTTNQDTINTDDIFVLQNANGTCRSITGANLKPTSGTNLSYGSGSNVNTLSLDESITSTALSTGCTWSGNAIAADKLSNGSVSDAEFQRLNGLTSAILQTSDKGAASGLCPLNTSSIIPNQYLPSSVSDILEVANFAALPATGDSSKIYVTIDNHKAYRWGGTSYVEISASLVIGTTAGTAYDGASGQTNANNIALKQPIITPGSNLSFSGNTLNVDSALTNITAVQATSNDLEIKTTTDNEIQFKTNNTERLSIDSTKLDSSVDINIPIDKHYQINGVDVLHNSGSSIILNAKFIQNVC